jgi:hypothetical protein
MDGGQNDAGTLVDGGPANWPITGSCAPDGVTQTLACPTQCHCGNLAKCGSTGVCEYCGCDAGEWCNETSGSCSYHACYGAPALLV